MNLPKAVKDEANRKSMRGDDLWNASSKKCVKNVEMPSVHTTKIEASLQKPSPMNI